MEVDGRQSLQEDRMSDCRSFGSIYHPSSQSRKISIGVMVDSLAKRRPEATKEDEENYPNAESIRPSTGISVEGNDKREAVTTSKGKQLEDTEQVRSPWISPRLVKKKSLAPETALSPAKNSNLRHKKHNSAMDMPVKHSVQAFANQTLNALNAGGNQSKCDDLTDGLPYKKKGRQEGNSQSIEDFNFSNARKALEPDIVVLEDKADKTQNIQTETLKMKLQELLGTISSPNSLQPSSQVREVNANNLKPEIRTDNIRDTFRKPRQNSDTIETDSDNPDKTIKRPVTRALTRKQAPVKMQPNKTKVGLSSKQTHGESNFPFGEGSSKKLDGAINSGSKLSRKNKVQKKSSKIDPHKIFFSEEVNADETKQTSYRNENPVPAEKTFILGEKMEIFRGSCSEKSRENFEKVQEKDSFNSPVNKKTNPQVKFHKPTSPEKGDKQEGFGNISLRNVVHTPDDFQSPTYVFRTPISNTSPSLTPKILETEQGASSPVPSERGFAPGYIRSFRTFQSSRPVCNKSNAQALSPKDAEKHHNSSLRNQMPAKETIDAASEHSEPLSEESLSESYEEGSLTIKRYNCHRENVISPETVPNFVHSPIKQFRNHEDGTLGEFCPTSPSQKGTGAGIGESYKFQESSEQDQGDELTRAVTLFALALETFKRKLDSAARKKSSEILMSIFEEIKSQLLNAESQIESDVRKLKSLHKTKRMRLETRLQEQQEQLKMIFEKFKEDIHHHLLDCSSILEGMEAHQIELKGFMKKQEASHQKLLMHVEEATEFQVNNAERRITAVHESAKEKMLQLKQVIAECLKDGIF